MAKKFFINGKPIEDARFCAVKEFVYDGCHKIYLLESDAQKQDILNKGYDMSDVHPIDELVEIWNRSCPLRFISYWDTTGFIDQFEDAHLELRDPRELSYCDEYGFAHDSVAAYLQRYPERKLGERISKKSKRLVVDVDCPDGITRTYLASSINDHKIYGWSVFNEE